MAPCICHPRKIMKLSVCGGVVSILGKGYSILHTILPNWKILTCCPLAAHMTSQRPCCHSRMPAVQKIMKQNKCVGKLIHKSPLGISVSGKIQEEPVSGFRSHIRADAPSERCCTCGHHHHHYHHHHHHRHHCLGFVHTLELMHHQSGAAHVVIITIIITIIIVIIITIIITIVITIIIGAG